MCLAVALLLLLPAASLTPPGSGTADAAPTAAPRLLPIAPGATFVVGGAAPGAELRGVDGTVRWQVFKLADHARTAPVRQGSATVQETGTVFRTGTPFSTPGSYDLEVSVDGSDLTTGFTVLSGEVAASDTVAGPYGVNGPWANSESVPSEVTDALRLTSSTTVRADVYWSGVEKHPVGERAASCSVDEEQRFDFTPYFRRLDPLFAENPAMRPLVLLSYGNAYWTGTDLAPPLRSVDADCLDRFAEYAAATARAFTERYGDGLVFEVWNEWFLNGHRSDAPDADSPESYQDLLGATTPAIRAVAPGAVVVGGSAGVISAAERTWFDRWVTAGGLDSVDGVSLHPYDMTHRPDSCTGTGPCVRGGLQWVTDRMAASTKPKPLYITEFGYPTAFADGFPPRTPLVAATYLVRAGVLSQQFDVPVFDAYELADSGGGQFGMLESASGRFASRPSYAGWITMAQTLGTSRFVSVEDVSAGAESVRVVEFRDDSAKTTTKVVWNVGHSVAADVDQRVQATVAMRHAGTLTEFDGSVKDVEPSSGQLAMTSTFEPRYLQWRD